MNPAVAPVVGAAHAGVMDTTPDAVPDPMPDGVADAEHCSPEGEALLPQPLVNRYAVPVTALAGGAFVAHEDQVVLQPVPGGFAPAGGGVTAADSGDGD